MWFTQDDCRIDEFRELAETKTVLADYPHAAAEEQGVLIYEELPAEEPAARREVQAELVRALTEGPGVVVFRGAVDPRVVDRATGVFTALIEEQRAAGVESGDHFAKPGANDRVWGALDKFALRDPAAFAAYYAFDVLALVSEAWLGPGYQVTSQVNVVNPGGVRQTAHRDYHLGFMDLAQASAYPAHQHLLSPALTLQGAVAHCDMPVESGPTMYLPHSHRYAPGYLAYHLPEFGAYFDEHHVQLPLAKGDAAFFNPALFHGAGTNHSAGVRRMANLLQVSSAFGRAMETVDTTAIAEAVFPLLAARRAEGAGERELLNVIAVAAEGYAFPTNLDRDQPIGGLAPQTQAALLREAVEEDWPLTRLRQALTDQQARRR